MKKSYPNKMMTGYQQKYQDMLLTFGQGIPMDTMDVPIMTKYGLGYIRVIRSKFDAMTEVERHQFLHDCSIGIEQEREVKEATK